MIEEVLFDLILDHVHGHVLGVELVCIEYKPNHPGRNLVALTFFRYKNVIVEINDILVLLDYGGLRVGVVEDLRGLNNLREGSMLDL